MDSKTLVVECRRAVMKIIEMYEEMDIDYPTFLHHTRNKIKHLKNYVHTAEDPVEAEKTMEVIREYNSTIQYYKYPYPYAMAKRG